MIPIFKLSLLLYRLRLGWLFGKCFMMLSHVGRRSGKMCRIILVVLQYDQQTKEIYAVSAWKGSDWYSNIQVAPAPDRVRVCPVCPQAAYAFARRDQHGFYRIPWETPDLQPDDLSDHGLEMGLELCGVP